MTEKVNIRELRANLAGHITDAQNGEYVVVTRDGAPVAAIIPIDAYQALEDAEDELLARAAEKAWETEKDLPRVTMAELLADMFAPHDEQAAG